ncbi:MAG: N-acetyl-gamma-glutamyl-phosphate reductase [Nitrospirae bacterium]|nr:N-acetyl-gamma-glutamyl-phosphate reductase [Nitrospirota bacterium]
MLKVAILGGSGYTGGELFRILQHHSHVKVTAVTSERLAGSSISELFLHSRDSILKLEKLHLATLKNKADLFFLCLPHMTSQPVVAYLNEAGKKVIDLSADFRLKSAKTYQEWYGTKHICQPLLKKAVYGLPEINRDKIRSASIIANPGCYPTSIVLALAPIIDKDFADTDSIIIDSKSGVSGAGRNPAQPFMFCEVNESVKAYAVSNHRHTPEIEQELNCISGKKIKIVFTPHLIPMDRGMLSTSYIRIKEGMTLSKVQQIYRNFYRNEPFVRVLNNGIYPATKAVKGSNYCDISVFLDKRSHSHNTLIIISAIDNLLKGASGQAVQNMNIMSGFNETEGLNTLPLFP